MQPKKHIIYNYIFVNGIRNSRFSTFDPIMLFRIILWSIIFTMALRFLLRFILPVIGVTKMAQDRMQQMQKQMEDMQRQANTTNTPPKQTSKPPQQVDGEYIEYEEVK